MLDREVSTRVPQRDNHGFVQFLLPPPDIGSAQLSVSCHLPGQLGESSAMCEFLHEVPQKRTCSPSTFSYPQKEKPIYVLGNLFAAVLWQKRRQFCSIIFICSPKEETSCPGSWGPFFVPISCKHILVNARSEWCQAFTCGEFSFFQSKEKLFLSNWILAVTLPIFVLLNFSVFHFEHHTSVWGLILKGQYTLLIE